MEITGRYNSGFGCDAPFSVQEHHFPLTPCNRERRKSGQCIGITLPHRDEISKSIILRGQEDNKPLFTIEPLSCAPATRTRKNGYVSQCPLPLATQLVELTHVPNYSTTTVKTSVPYRKITPPPWTKVVYSNPLTLRPPELNINTGIRNPFRKEMFKSVVDKRDSLINTVGIQNQRLADLTERLTKGSLSKKSIYRSLQSIPGQSARQSASPLASDKPSRKISYQGKYGYSPLAQPQASDQHRRKFSYQEKDEYSSLVQSTKNDLDSAETTKTSHDLTIQHPEVELSQSRLSEQPTVTEMTGLSAPPKSVMFDLEFEEENFVDDPNNLSSEFSLMKDHYPTSEIRPSLSISDSGIGIEDELRSLSRVSMLTLSDDDDSLSSLNSSSEEQEVLCGSRVSQMTKTYNDIDAVTRLLQEKESDLELAARIGQQLLARNRVLEEKVSTLETEVTSSNDKITQLRHGLQVKSDLLQIYTNDVDESSVDSTPTGLRHFSADVLQRRVDLLEDENKHLRHEASQLAFDTEDCEDREKQLVDDVIKQLSDANHNVCHLSDELSKKVEDTLRQQEDTTQLLAQLVEVQSNNKRYCIENEELTAMLGVARECQTELTTELAGFKEKYTEVLDLLHDTQEQLRRAHKKNMPGSRGSHLTNIFPPFHGNNDSIANELQSLQSANGEEDSGEGVKRLNRAFDIVKLSSRNLHGDSSCHLTPTRQASHLPTYLTTSVHTTESKGSDRYSPYFSSSQYGGSSGLPSLDSGPESDASFYTDSDDNYPASRCGVPGWPGTPDLENRIKLLDRISLPYGCRTPDSIMSTGSGKMSSSLGSEWRLPQKMQIVKPMEGSLTLHHWSQLATPHFGGVLDEREGVTVKGATNVNLNLDVYSMSDLEEDEDEADIGGKRFPGKQFMHTSGINTYTNSTVLHPDDITNLTSSLQQTHISVIPTAKVDSAKVPSTPPTPSHGAVSRRGSTATYSTNAGLAKHLNERGFSTTSDGSILPTATPANSPQHSRPQSPEPYSYKLPGLEELTKTFHSGASFLRRTLYGSSSPASAAHKINLVEKVQALGVDTFVNQGSDVQLVGGVITTRPQTPSPLLQLSQLIKSGSKNKAADDHNTNIFEPTKITSPGTRRPILSQRSTMGIPARPGAGHLDSKLAQLKPGQRNDLGTVGNVAGRARPSALGTVPGKRPDQQIGAVSWIFMGRKGGLL